jgi:hypothetical protein
MTVNDETIKERRITAFISDHELRTLLVNHVARDAKFVQTGATRTEVQFHNDFREGKGFEVTANITLVNDLD